MAFRSADTVRDLTAKLFAEAAIDRYQAARDLGALGEKARAALPEIIDLLGEGEITSPD